jgi:hypothetical protein
MPDRDRGQVDLAEFLEELPDQPVFVRACLIRGDAGWAVHQCDIVVGKQLPRDRPAVWRYQDAVFIARPVKGDALRAWFHADTESELRLGEDRATVSQVWETVNFHREPSLARHSTPRFPWPHVVYEIGAPWHQSTTTAITGHLVGEDSPSFPTFEHATQAFFTGDVSLARGGGSGFSSLARVRVLQQGAWLSRITVTATHIDVRVAGPARQGVRLELNGSTGSTSRRVGTRGRIRIPLPEGLPDDAWLYLSRGPSWLDYRALGSAFGGPADDGVEVELTSDPATEIHALLSVGEGPQMEYKRQLPGRDADSRRKVLKTVAAFANGGGGHIVFGMDADETTIVGLESADPKEVRDRLGQLIRGNVVPRDASFSIESAELGSKLVVALRVEPSPSRPYGLQFNDRPVEFYVRRGASTFAATAEEVRSLAQPPSIDRHPTFFR